jgi:hypothetical protein
MLNLSKYRKRTIAMTIPFNPNGQPVNNTRSANKNQTHPNAKLTEADVREIRRLYSTENLSINAITERYPVTKSTIADIVKGKSWQNVLP